jgi:hypothetical protein
MKTGSIRTDLFWLLLLCCLLSAGVGWSLLDAAEGSLLGSRHIDALGSYWFQWFVFHQMETGGDLSQTNLWFHPWGIDILRTYGGNLIDPLLALPMRWVGGPILAWNGLVFLILISNGLVAGAWVRLRSGNLLAGLAGSAMALLHPVVFYDLVQGRPAQAILAPLIGALALFEASTRSQSTRNSRRLAAGAGVCIGIAGYCYWFGGLFAALACVLLALGGPWKARLQSLGIAAITTLLSISPLLLPLLMTLSDGASGALLPVDRWWAGELDLVTRAGDSITLCTLDGQGFALKTLREKSQIDAPLLGICALLGVLATVRKAWRWSLVAGLGLAIALGPMPWGFRNPIYLIIATLPAMDRLYWPCRAIVLTVPVAALGAGILVETLQGRRAQVLAAVIGLLCITETAYRDLAPLDTWQLEIPESVSCLTDAEGAVISLPYGRDHEHILHQTVHQNPLLGGIRETSKSLAPAEQQEWVRGNPWLDAMMRIIRDPRTQTAWEPEDKEAVSEEGYRWILLRWEALPRPNLREGMVKRERMLERAISEHLGPPLVDDGTMRIYAPWGGELDCDLSIPQD